MSYFFLKLFIVLNNKQADRDLTTKYQIFVVSFIF